jgi:hypothetical protein
LRRRGEALSDEQLKEKLFNKLDSSLFHHVAWEIEKDQDMTFSAACKLIRQNMDMHNSFARGKKRSISALEQINSQMSHELKEMKVTSIQSAPSPQISVGCFNCRGDHRACECRALFCRGCRQVFRAETDPKYHTLDKCQMQLKRRQGRSNGDVVTPSSVGGRRFVVPNQRKLMPQNQSRISSVQVDEPSEDDYWNTLASEAKEEDDDGYESCNDNQDQGPEVNV